MPFYDYHLMFPEKPSDTKPIKIALTIFAVIGFMASMCILASGISVFAIFQLGNIILLSEAFSNNIIVKALLELNYIIQLICFIILIAAVWELSVSISGIIGASNSKYIIPFIVMQGINIILVACGIIMILVSNFSIETIQELFLTLIGFSMMIISFVIGIMYYQEEKRNDILNTFATANTILYTIRR